ncbi:MAG: Ig-like domain-containing protein [Candidatus Sulfotelmatobacter sp.]
MGSFTPSYPGVYIEELSSGQHTITGVATSIAAFIGWAPQGPVNEAVMVESFPAYQAIFGSFVPGVYLAYAVNQFFQNGGQQAYIVRLVWDGTQPPANGIPAAAATAQATGVGYATAEIIATIGAISGSAQVSVGTKVLQSIAVTPANLPPLPIGASVQLAATGSYSDGSSGAVTVNWTSNNPAVLSVTSAGVATAASAGTATVTATYNSSSLDILGSVTVTAASLASITVAPSAPSLAAGQWLQLGATATYSDGTTPNVTDSVLWGPVGSSITLTSVALTSGVLTITAPNTFASGNVVVFSNVGVATWLNGVLGEVLSANASMFEVSLVGYANYPSTPDSGTVSVVTTAVTPTVPWTFPSGTTPTPVTSTSVSITVNAAVVTSLTLTPASATVPLVLQAPETEPPSFTAYATYSNGTTTTLSTATFTSSNPAVATVSPSGALSVLSAGSTTVTATFTSTTTPSYSVSGSTTLTVTNAHLKTLSVTPPTLSIASGLSQQLTATGIFDDGSSVDLSGSVSWSAAPADATFSLTGVVTAAKSITTPTPVTITATWMSLTANATLTVTPPIPQSIAVTSSSASIPAGGTLPFTATVTYSDGSAPATPVSWSSSSPNVATVNNLGVASAVAAGGSLTLFATSPGAWGNSIQVSIATQPPPNSSRFSLLVQQMNSKGQLQTLQSFANLSVNPTDPQYVVTVIDNDCNYVTFINPATNLPVAPTAAPSSTSAPIALSGGADGEILIPASDQNFEIALNETGFGLSLLDSVDIFNLLCVPGETDVPTITDLQSYCFTQRAFLIVDAPQLATVSNFQNSALNGPYGTSTAGNLAITGPYTSSSAYYYPWILAPDPAFGNRPALFPPCGCVAGIYASTDVTRGVWKAPAGINASFSQVLGLQVNLTDQQNGLLNPMAVNCLRQLTYGQVVWGSRTMAGADIMGSQWKYVPIRRLALFLESSLYDGTQWVVFEPNDETLWGQIRLSVGTFLQGLFLQGAFAGTTPQQAYFVKCDAENNPDSSVAQGIVNILVGFAPLYPAEFVLIQIQQIVNQS